MFDAMLDDAPIAGPDEGRLRSIRFDSSQAIQGHGAGYPGPQSVDVYTDGLRAIGAAAANKCGTGGTVGDEWSLPRSGLWEIQCGRSPGDWRRWRRLGPIPCRTRTIPPLIRLLQPTFPNSWTRSWRSIPRRTGTTSAALAGMHSRTTSITSRPRRVREGGRRRAGCEGRRRRGLWDGERGNRAGKGWRLCEVGGENRTCQISGEKVLAD